jgi:hypothetical protein
MRSISPQTSCTCTWNVDHDVAACHCSRIPPCDDCRARVGPFDDADAYPGPLTIAPRCSRATLDASHNRSVDVLLDIASEGDARSRYAYGRSQKCWDKTVPASRRDTSHAVSRYITVHGTWLHDPCPHSLRWGLARGDASRQAFHQVRSIRGDPCIQRAAWLRIPAGSRHPQPSIAERVSRHPRLLRRLSWVAIRRPSGLHRESPSCDYAHVRSTSVQDPG